MEEKLMHFEIGIKFGWYIYTRVCSTIVESIDIIKDIYDNLDGEAQAEIDLDNIVLSLVDMKHGKVNHLSYRDLIFISYREGEV